MSQIDGGRAEAAAVIWSWRDSREAASRPPLPGELRRRGLLRSLAAGVVGAAVLWFWSPLLGWIAVSISALLALAALISPLGIYAMLERALGALVHWTGVLLTRVLMALIFYGVFTPFGWIFRRGRRDPLRRYADATAGTYWEVAERGRSASASRRQAW